MHKLLKVIKASLHTVISTAVLLCLFIYIVVHFNLVGVLAKHSLANEFAEYLGTEVSVENVDVDWFNQVVLDNLLIKDQLGDTLIYSRRSMLSYDIMPLLHSQLKINTIQLLDFDIRLSKADSISEPNYKFLVDVFVSKDNNKKGGFDDISVNSLYLRDGSLSYDVKDATKKKQFIDKNHLAFSGISANMKFTFSKDSGLNVKAKRLEFKEKSGLCITHLSTDFSASQDFSQLKADNIKLNFEQTLTDRHIAYAEVLGTSSLINDSLSIDVNNLNVEVPDMAKLVGNVKASDYLKENESLVFNANIEELNITSLASSYLTDKVLKTKSKDVRDYIADLGEISLKGTADGTLKVVNYNLDVNSLGDILADLHLSGIATNDSPINTDVEATINNLPFKDHIYSKVLANGHVTKNSYDGNVSISDRLCELLIDGMFENDNGLNIIDADAEVLHFEPYALHLTQWKNLDSLSISGNIVANCNFRKLDRIIGNIEVDSLLISRSEDSLTIHYIDFTAREINGKYIANANSPLFDIDFNSSKEISKFQGVLKEEKRLSDILRLPIALNKDVNYRVELDSLNRLQYADVHVPEAIYEGKTVKADLSTYGGTTDSLNHILQFDCKADDYHVSTVLYATSTFSPLSVIIKPCQINFNGQAIDCKGASLTQLDSKTYDLRNLSLNYKNQHLDANGIFSSASRNNATIHIENLELDRICGLLEKRYLAFGGIGTGDIFFSSDSLSHIFTKNLFVKDFSYIETVLGDNKMKCDFDLNKKRLTFDCAVLTAEKYQNTIKGYYQNSYKDTIDILVDADHLPIGFLDNWVGDYIQELQGNATGEMHLFGPSNKMRLLGTPYLSDMSFTNDLIGSRIYYNDTIFLQEKDDITDGHIEFHNGKLNDKFGHIAYLNADIRHNNLHNFSYDVKIDFPETQQGFLLFDKPTHYNNELYWGQLYATGVCQMHGADSRHRIELSCKTAGKSQLNLSPGEDNYSDSGYNFLTFRDKSAFLESEQSQSQSAITPAFVNNQEDDTYIELDIQAQATENCQVYVQMDPLAEDRLICRGKGDLSMHYDPRHDITFGGEYNITSGSYLVTMRGDLMNKEFQLQEGSKVTLPGNFSDAELNLDAVYSLPSVNLKDLDESFATMTSMNRTTLPVDCKLKVTGQLSAPQISFDLDVKNTSDDVQALVHNIIGTPEMLNREVFYLLLFSKFYTPEYATASQNHTGSELTSFASSSLTSQLNNLLGHVSDNFTLGTNFRSDKGDFSDMEMDLSLSTRMFNDRLILNGNLGYRDPANRIGLTNNNTSFIGDFDAEYLLNPSGTYRIKAYSHYNERDYSINNALTTQGIGFIVRKDFKSLKELLFLKKFLKK